MVKQKQRLILRDYQPSDCAYLAELFYETVHSVNARDYTGEQLDVWATGSVDLEAWNRSFLEHHTVVAVVDASDMSVCREDTTDAFQASSVWEEDDENSFLCTLTLENAIDSRAFSGFIAGFGDMDQMGYLDRLYVHKDYQGKGIATAICDELERRMEAGKTAEVEPESVIESDTGADIESAIEPDAEPGIESVIEQDTPPKKITVHASITAKPFFQSRGYRVVREQKVVRRGISLTNYVMEKE